MAEVEPNGDRRTADQALEAAREALARYDETLTRWFRNPDDQRALEASGDAAEDIAQAFRRIDDLARGGDLPAAWKTALTSRNA